MLVIILLVIKFGFLKTLPITLSLDNFLFTCLVLSTICIAAAGYVINDIKDVAIDHVNKPQKVLIGKSISERAAYNYFFALTVIGVILGFYVSNSVGHPGLAAVFIIASGLLYMYAISFKSQLLIGNLIISGLVSLSLLLLILFDIYPGISKTATPVQLAATKIILLYAFFAFYINLMREIAKDLEDINGDKKGERITLPIVLGRKRTVLVLFSMSVVVILALLYANYKLFYNSYIISFYFIFVVGGPLLFFCLQSWNATTKKNFSTLSLTLKLIMLTGIFSFLFMKNFI